MDVIYRIPEIYKIYLEAIQNIITLANSRGANIDCVEIRSNHKTVIYSRGNSTFYINILDAMSNIVYSYNLDKSVCLLKRSHFEDTEFYNSKIIEKVSLDVVITEVFTTVGNILSNVYGVLDLSEDKILIIHSLLVKSKTKYRLSLKETNIIKAKLIEKYERDIDTYGPNLRNKIHNFIDFLEHTSI